MLTTDWHLHTRNSCDCRDGSLKTTMAETVAAIGAAGIRDFGVTDHLHTPFNLPDVAASRREFDALPPNPRRHFGIELSVVSVWELAEIAKGGHAAPVYGLRGGGPPDAEPALGIGVAELATFGVEYVVGGTHWPLYVPLERERVIRDYHRQNMFLATHPLVNIVAHPWWWMGHWQEKDGNYRTGPWFDDFRSIPQSLHDEFAAAVLQHGKAVEVNLHAQLLNHQYPEAYKRQYLEYIAGLKAKGVRLSIGSDHHAQHHRYEGSDIAQAEAMLATVGITDVDFWRLPPRVPSAPVA